MAGAKVLQFSTLLSSVALLGAINIPQATMFGTEQRVCNYQYAIPNGADCVTYGPSLEQHLDAVQQDMDRIKLQYVSQNTVLLEELRKLRQQASTTDANLNDLTKDLKSLQGTVFTLQAKVTQNIGTNNNNGNSNSNAAANAMLQQLVTTTRTQLTQDLLKLQNQVNAAMGSLRSDLQQDAVQQSQVDSAFQAQLRQQQKDLTTVLQNLMQLKNRVDTLQQTTSTASPTLPPVVTTSTSSYVPQTAPPQVTVTSGPVTPSPLLLQLQSDLNKLDSRVAQVEKDVQSDLPDIQKDVVDLQATAKNHKDQLDNLKLEVDYVETSEIPDLKSQIKTNYDAISLLSRTVQNDLKPLELQVQKVVQNVTSLNQQITRLGTDFLSQKVQLTKDEMKINDLELQVHFQASRLSNLIKEQHFTRPSPPSTKPPPTTTFRIPTPRPRPSGGGNSQSFIPKPVQG